MAIRFDPIINKILTKYVKTTGDTVTGDLKIEPTSNSTTTFQVNQSDSTNVLTVDTTNGRVGVGTGTPLAPFHIAKNNTPNLFFIDNATSTGASGAQFFLRRSRGTIASPSIVSAGDRLALFSAQGYNTAAYTNTAAGFRILVDGEPSTNVPGKFQFLTTEATGATDQVRMTIKANGNVGISSSDPLSKLSIGDLPQSLLRTEALGVYEDGSTGVAILVSRASNDSGGSTYECVKSRGTHASPSTVSAGDDLGGIFFSGYNDQVRAAVAYMISQVETGVSATGADFPTRLAFYTTPDGSATASERMRIDNAGNVTIGAAASANARLEIVGSADDQQLIVKANSTQTANILEIQDSSSTVLAGADERGILFSDGGTSVDNVFIGSNAGRPAAGVNATDNVGIGEKALDALTTGDNNIGLGTNALGATTEGSRNVAIGSSTLDSLTTGTQNMAVGTQSLQAITTTGNNAGIGYQAGKSVTGSGNTYIGAESGENQTSGSLNTCIGVRAGQSPSANASDNNTFIGYQTGLAITTGSDNVFIGLNAGSRQSTNSNLLIIDNQTRADVATELTNSILYGTMAATPASQSLRINAELGIQATPTTAGITFGEANNLVFGTTTGTKIGTATNQKLGFFNVTPVVQQATIADADGTLADITTKFNTLLAQIEALGLNASS